MYITKKNLKEKSKELLKDKVYILKCDNYEDKQSYYLQNGKVYKNDIFNFAYAKEYHKTSLKKDSIYNCTLIDSKHNKLYNINN